MAQSRGGRCWVGPRLGWAASHSLVGGQRTGKSLLVQLCFGDLGFGWEQVSYDPEKGDSRPSALGVRDQRLDYHFMSRASAWPREVQLEPEDRDSFSSQLIKREVSSPHEFSLQY